MSKIDSFVNEINKKFGEEIIMKGNKVPQFDKIPFSSPRLNYMTYGGVPIGKSTELFGPENGGKSTTAIDLAGNAQNMAKNKYESRVFYLENKIKKLEEKTTKKSKREIKKYNKELQELEKEGPRKVLWIDSEHTYDPDWAEKNGVNTENLMFFKPQQQTAEEILEVVVNAVDTGQILLVIIDSIPMLISGQKMDKGMTGKTYGGNAAALTDFSKIISPKLSKNESSLVAINQTRADFDNKYNLYKTPGGRAWKHLHALRLLIRKGKYFDNNLKELSNSTDEPKGNFVRVRIDKTKCCKPDRREGFYTLHYSNGIDLINDTIDVAIYNDLMSRRGAWYYILEDGGVVKEEDGEEIKFQGRTALVNYFEENEEKFEELYEKLNDRITSEE